MTANMTPLYLDIWSKPWPEVVAGLSGLASLSDYLAQPIDAGPPEAPGTRASVSASHGAAVLSRSSSAGEGAPGKARPQGPATSSKTER